MALRVRVRLEARAGSSPGTALDSVALVNTGYEARSADCSLPREAARRLGLWPPPPGSPVLLVRGYTGQGHIHRVPDGVSIQLLLPDASCPGVLAGVILADTDDEIILSDALVERLGIEPVKPASGVWRLSGEARDRRGEAAERW